MKIFYGISDKNIDVTEICYQKLMKNNIIYIPSGDGNRADYFTDPLKLVLKKIIIYDKNDVPIEYDDTVKIQINTLTNDITIENNKQVDSAILNIHKKLKIKYGSFNEELPEQRMAVRYLTGSEKVLEIGGNIGRNSLIIASILNEQNNNNFVTLECDAGIARQLTENRNLNCMTFHIENSALSKRKLIQKGWDTIVSDELLPGYKNVNIISWEEIQQKYNIVFDTLVLDCEGAFYYILMDIPEILNNINLIIMENDYLDFSKKKYVNQILENNGFFVDYVESGGWGPCYNNFFEVWKK